MVGYTARPPPRGLVPMPTAVVNRPRRLTPAVASLQVKMHELLMVRYPSTVASVEGDVHKQTNKQRDAVELFETFVNSAFKEAAEMNIIKGQLPFTKRPGEFQWLQYIQALNRLDQDAAKESVRCRVVGASPVLPIELHPPLG